MDCEYRTYYIDQILGKPKGEHEVIYYQGGNESFQVEAGSVHRFETASVNLRESDLEYDYVGNLLDKERDELIGIRVRVLSGGEVIYEIDGMGIIEYTSLIIYRRKVIVLGLVACISD